MTTKLLFRLLPAQILLAAIGSINGIVSSLFASNAVGEEAMSAIGLYCPLNQFFMAVGMLLVGGSSILCGKYIGRNQSDKIQNTFSLSITIALLFSALFVILLLISGIFDLTGFLTKDPVIRPLLNQYMIGRAIGLIPYVLGGLLASFLTLENKTKRVIMASIVCILVNVVLTYLFVNVLRMQAFGLALASSLALWVCCIIQAWHFLFRKSIFHFSWKGLDWRESGNMIRIGLPGAANCGYQTITWSVINMLILQFVGSAGLSAFAAANTLLEIFWAIPLGMVYVSRMLISVSVGEEDRKTLVDTMRNALYRFTPLMCAVTALLVALAVPLTRLYYRDPQSPVYMMTVWGFRILPLAMPLTTLRLHFVCYEQTVDRNVMVNVLEALDGCVSICLLAVILIPSMGMNSTYIACVLNGVISILYLLGYAILKNRRMPRNMEEFMVIPAGFGVPEKQRIDRSIHNVYDVINLSETVQRFCLEQGGDDRRAFFAGLFMEEMAGNVVTHGFYIDKKKHSVDVRVVYKEDNMILRIKDDCIPFDPMERWKLFDPGDFTKNIGIRIVFEIARDISYQNILGLNILTIKI